MLDASAAGSALLLQSLPESVSDLAVVFVFGALGGVLFVLGVSNLSRGTVQLRRWLRVRSLAREPVQSVLAGPVEVAGSCQPGDEPLTQPFGEDHCVFAYWEVYEKGRPGPIARGTHSGPFRLEDETGTVLVDDPLSGSNQATPELQVDEETGSVRLQYGSVGGSDLGIPAVILRLARTKLDTIVVDPDEQPSSPVAEWCRANRIPPVADTERQYVQYLLPVGATVRVRGEARQSTSDGGEFFRIERDSMSEQLVITDGDERFLGAHRKAVFGLLSGAVIYTVAGLWLLWLLV